MRISSNFNDNFKQIFEKLILNWHKVFFISCLVFSSILLIYTSSTLSISHKEALIYFGDNENNKLLYYLMHIFTYILGQNDIAIRLPFILFYTASVILMYQMTQDYFKYETDRLISVLIFMFLPGIIGASLLVNSSIIVLFCVLLYFYLYKITQKHNYYLLAVFLFVDHSFAILFLALFFYALQQRKNELLVISLVLFGISMSIYGFDPRTLEKPRSHVFDLFGIYASIFSPAIFLYFIYAMYRIGLKEEKTILWYTSAVVFIFSFILSFKQKIYIDSFAPFVVIATPMMVKLYLHSLRVRLPMFRHHYLKIGYFAVFILVTNVFIVLFNKPIYFILENKEKHFAYDFHFAKEIAHILKNDNITSISTNDKELASRLRFYGISNDSKTNYITLKPFDLYDKKYDISFLGKKLISLYYVDLGKQRDEL